MNSDEIRSKYIAHFKSKEHKEISAARLLAENDPTLLFVNSGMFPLVPYLLGEKHPSGKRLVNYQRSFRTDDIEEVGDKRHTTFFEMLGNWSLGDYFKKDQLNWWYEFIIDVLKLEPDRIYQSVFVGNDLVQRDEESILVLQDIYKKYGISSGVGPATLGDGEKGPGQEIDFSKSRIFPYLDKNWWKRGDAIGELGGPDSETFYDTGKPHDPIFGKFCHVNCSCGRFIEIGNSVFMQYRRTAYGWEELAQKNVDFGGGLERLTMVSNHAPNLFKTDVFSSYIQFIENQSNQKYEDNSASYEIVTDHIRAVTFLIGDGGVPSNKDQGYFIRRLIRRGLVHLNKVGAKFEVFADLSKLVIKKMSDVYPQLVNNQEQITGLISEEVQKFSKTLDKGVKYFNEIQPINNIISGHDAFNLLSTYGFPIELTREMAQERGCIINEKEFLEDIARHKDLSRQGSEQKFKSGLADSSEATTRLHTATHILHQALREVLGEHVQQKGSNITPERLRFDFSHGQKMTDEEIRRVEKIVNENIAKKLPVFCEETSPEDAKKHGAIGLFDEKYGEKVTVYSIGASLDNEDKPFSREICTGPHVKNTEELVKFEIIKEEACSSGIRRIKAVLS